LAPALALLLLAAPAARAQGPIVVDRIPVVLKQHFPTMPSMFARGIDFVASFDTTGVLVYLRNDGPLPLADVQAQFPPAPGFQFAPGPANFGTIMPGARVGRVVPLRTMGATPGVHLLPVIISAPGYFGQSAMWLTVWDAKLTAVDVVTGEMSGVAVSPFTTHRWWQRSPEIMAGGLPSFFDLQALRDTVDQAVPFHGVHWGDYLQTTGEEPDTTPQDGAQTSSEVFRQRLHARTKSGDPVPGAVFTVRSGSEVKSCVTDANGDCYVEGLTAGEYEKCVHAPALLRKFYGSGCKTEPKTKPQQGNRSVTEVMWPDIPSGTSGTTDSPPAGGQGQNPNPSAGGPGDPPNTTRTTGVSILSLIGLAATDVIAAPTGAGTPYAIGSGIAVVSGTAAAGWAADPRDQDLLTAGEQNTVPFTETELTHREVIDVSVQLLQPTIPGTGYHLINQFEFTRFTDLAEYRWASAETLHVPQDLFFDVVAEPDPVTHRYSVIPRDTLGMLTGSQVLVQAWLLARDDGRVIQEVMLQDDGNYPDLAPNDGRFGGALPDTAHPQRHQLLVWVTRTGWDAAAVPPQVAFQDVPLGSVLSAEGPGMAGRPLALRVLGPHPAHGLAKVSFDLPVRANVLLELFDPLGRLVSAPAAGRMFEAGRHQLSIPTDGLPAGLYLLRLSAQPAAGGTTTMHDSAKLVLIP
jgi:hypothetical protein